MPLCLTLLCLLLLTSCARHAPEPVRISVEDYTAVAGCALRCVVQANSPNWSQKTAVQRLQSSTEWLGGNTLLLTKLDFWYATGLAYRCDNPPHP